MSFAPHPELIVPFENGQAKNIFWFNLGTKPSFWFVNEGCEGEFGKDHFQGCSPEDKCPAAVEENAETILV